MRTDTICVDDLIPVSLATLTFNSALGINIYWRPQPKAPALLFCSECEEVNVESLQNLMEQGLTKLYIHRDDSSRYQRHLRENWRKLISNVQQPVPRRISLMSEVIREVLKEQFTTGTTETIVATCQAMGSQSVSLLTDETVALRDLYRVLYHDYGTFTHSANVSAYAVLLGHALSFSQDELRQIAVGGLLHDIGKIEISDRILNKPGKLDDAEMREVQKHPTTGLQRVADRTDLNIGQMMMIYQHHERCDGSGYPVGCSSDEIHPWAKLCAIVDIYEALTSLRPYRHPLSTSAALAVLDREGETKLDKEMLECWRQLVKA